jgi:hypothetical protein
MTTGVRTSDPTKIRELYRSPQHFEYVEELLVFQTSVKLG